MKHNLQSNLKVASYFLSRATSMNPVQAERVASHVAPSLHHFQEHTQEKKYRFSPGWFFSAGFPLLTFGALLYATSQSDQEKTLLRMGRPFTKIIHGDAKRAKYAKDIETIQKIDPDFERVIKRLNRNDPKVTVVECGIVLPLEKMKELQDALTRNTEIGHIQWHQDQQNSQERQAIEEQLMQRNRSFRFHPSDYTHGLLSKHVYAKELYAGQEISSPGLAGWEVCKVYHNDNREAHGYRSVLYKQKKNHQMVLVFAGTDLSRIQDEWYKPESQMKTNLHGIVFQEIVKAQEFAFEDTEDAWKLAQEAGYRLSFAGHSLGAWLAELSLYFWSSVISKESPYHTHLKAVTFDSPGSASVIKKLQPNMQQHGHVDIRNLQIVTYLSPPNIVNTCDKHINEAFVVFPAGSTKEEVISRSNQQQKLNEKRKNEAQQDSWLQWLKKPQQAYQSLAYHSLDLILECFDPETGLPKSGYYAAKDWPAHEYNNTIHASGFDIKKISPKLAPIIHWMLANSSLLGSTVRVVDLLCSKKMNVSQFWEALDAEQKSSFDNYYRGHYHVKQTQLDDQEVSVSQRIFQQLYHLHHQDIDTLPCTPLIKVQLKQIKNSYHMEPAHNASADMYRIQALNGDSIHVLCERLQRLMMLEKGIALWLAKSHPQVTSSQEQPSSQPTTYPGISSSRVTDVLTEIKSKEFGLNRKQKEGDSQYYKRTDPVKQLNAVLNKQRHSNHKKAIISGTAGLGKTTLAREYSKSFAATAGKHHYTLFISARNLDQEIRDLLEAFGENTKGKSTKDLAEAFYSALSLVDGHILLVLDDVPTHYEHSPEKENQSLYYQKKESDNEALLDYILRIGEYSYSPKDFSIIITALNNGITNAKWYDVNFEVNVRDLNYEEVGAMFAMAHLKPSFLEIKTFRDNGGNKPIDVSRAINTMIEENCTLKTYTNSPKLSSHTNFWGIRDRHPQAFEFLKVLTLLNEESIPWDFLVKVLGYSNEEIEGFVEKLQDNIILIDKIKQGGHNTHDNKAIMQKTLKIHQTVTENVDSLNPIERRKVLEKILAKLYSFSDPNYLSSSRLVAANLGALLKNAETMEVTTPGFEALCKALADYNLNEDLFDLALAVRRKITPSIEEIDWCSKVLEKLWYKKDTTEMQKYCARLEVLCPTVHKNAHFHFALLNSYKGRYASATGDKLEAVTCFETTLAELEKLPSSKNASTLYARTLYDLAKTIESTHPSKALEMLKQAYTAGASSAWEPAEKELCIAAIHKIQPSFTPSILDKGQCQSVGECRLFVGNPGNAPSYKDMRRKLAKHDLPSTVSKRVNKESWSYRGWNPGVPLLGQWGLKGYLDEGYLRYILKKEGIAAPSAEELRRARAILFEAMNCGIMHITADEKTNVDAKRPWHILEAFVQEYPDVIKEVANSAPIFFVDRRIVNKCIEILKKIKDDPALREKNEKICQNYEQAYKILIEKQSKWNSFTAKVQDERQGSAR